MGPEGFGGFPVVKYTGFNAAQVLRALRLNPGDAVAVGPDRSYVISREALESVPVFTPEERLSMRGWF